MEGWISQCVYEELYAVSGFIRALSRSLMVMAIMVVSSSSASMYSMKPCDGELRV
jgi:hypothetical protein